MTSPLKQIKDIPTISYLYRTKKIRAPTAADVHKGNQDHNETVCTVQYDLTKLQVDAIVNAANRSLLGGGGVDGAIHRAAGPKLFDECRTLQGCDTGSAKITDAYNLPCKKVIHAVGPIYHDEQTSQPLLRGCYRTALQLAVENDCKSIAFSAISTGIYGYPSKDAAKAALREVASFLRKPEGKKLDKIIFCNFLDKDVNAYAEAIPEVFPPTEGDLSELVCPSLEAEPHLEDGKRSEEQSYSQNTSKTVQSYRRLVTEDNVQNIEETKSQTVVSSEKGWTHDKDGGEDEMVRGQTARSIGYKTYDTIHEQLGDDIAQPITSSKRDEPGEASAIGSKTISHDGTAISKRSSSGDIKEPSMLTEADEVDAGSESKGWKEFGTRSRSGSEIEPNEYVDIGAESKKQQKSTSENKDCLHDWVMVGDDEKVDLWPKGRHRCTSCHAIMGWNRK